MPTALDILAEPVRMKLLEAILTASPDDLIDAADILLPENDSAVENLRTHLEDDNYLDS